MKKIAIIGSRHYNNGEKIEKYMRGLTDLAIKRGEELIFVSGGCETGADALAKNIALKNGWQYKEFPPAHKSHNEYCVLSPELYNKPYNVQNFFDRNKQIAEYSDVAMAFIVRGKSWRGTKNCVDHFANLGKHIFYFWHV